MMLYYAYFFDIAGSYLSKQLEKHICHKCPEVAVLSAFPLYVLDYFGCERTITKLNS